MLFFDAVERTEGVSKINCTMPPYSQLGGSPDTYVRVNLRIFRASDNHILPFEVLILPCVEVIILN